MQHIDFCNLTPGCIVSTPYGPFTHVGIVSDRLGSDGYLTVISNSLRRGGVVEETMTEFADGRAVSIDREVPGIQALLAVQKARARLGRPWSPFYNCEHFVEDALGNEVRSPQLRWVVAALAVVLVLAGSKGG